MNCPKCSAKMRVSVEIEGGCQGHGEGEYCYCPNPDIHAEFECPNRYTGAKCKQHNIRIDELSDRDSVARWLTSNYDVVRGFTIWHETGGVSQWHFSENREDVERYKDAVEGDGYEVIPAKKIPGREVRIEDARKYILAGNESKA